MPPSIITHQARGRLPPKWMTPTSPATTVSTPTLSQQQQDPPSFRWSTHTLAAGSAEQEQRLDSIITRSSSPSDTFALRRKSRISDLTCVDIDDDCEDDAYTFSSKDAPLQDDVHSGVDSEGETEELSARIDHLMASTMHALEASNRLVLDTLETRAKLAHLHYVEAALDSQFTTREASLRRQIQAVDDMSDFVSRKSLELQHLTRPSSVNPSAMKGTEHSGVSAQGTGIGIVQAMDGDATIGKTAAKRLEKMLQGPTSPVAPRRTSASRRTFSVNTYGPVHDSIAEEERPGSNQTLSTIMPPLSTIDMPTVTPVKKRSVSYDIANDRGARLMPSLAGPSRAVSSGTAAVVIGPPSAAPTFTSEDRVSHNVRSISTSTGNMTSSNSAGSAETSLAAIMGIPSRTETPSDASYFDSSMEDSITSASPSTPGSTHAIHDVLAKNLQDDAIPIPRRISGTQHVSRASFSLTEREKSSDPFQLAQLRAEQVTWHSNGKNSNGNRSPNAGCVDDASLPRSANGRGGALKALQRLNELSSARLSTQQASNEDESTWYGGSSKRSSLGLGLPSFSALRPITNRAPSISTPTTTVSDSVSSGDGNIVSENQGPGLASTRPTGWKGWTSWNASNTTLTQ